MQRSLGSSALRGGAVTLVAQGAKLGIQLAGVVVLSRILSPADFGLIAILTAVVALGELLRDFGLLSASVQAPALSRQQKTNLFYVNLGIGVALSLALVAASPAIAGIFSDGRLVAVSAAMSIIFLLNGLQVQFQVEIIRGLRFTTLAFTDVVAGLFGLAVAISTAVAGFGYWALVFQYVTTALVLLVARMVFSGWWPGRPARSEGIRGFLSYGGYLGAAHLLQYAATYTDTFIIGIRFGAQPLGFYNRAFQVLMVPLGQVLSPLTNVALPVLSRVADQRSQFYAVVRAAQIVSGYLAALLFSVVVVFSEQIVDILLGAEWGPTAPVLAILAVAGLFNVLGFNGYWVFLAQGRTKALFHYNLVTKSLMVALILFGSTFGVLGVAGGFALGLVCSWPISIVWLGRVAGMPVREFLSSGLRSIFAGIAGVLFGFGSLALSSSLPGWLQLSVGVFASTTGFVIFCGVVARGDVSRVRGVLRLVKP